MLRGIAKKDWIKNVEGELHIVNEAFLAPVKPEARREKLGKPPGHELSINWEDDPLAALAATARDRDISEYGAAILPARDVRAERVLAAHVFLERAPIRGNPFHGNIVLHSKSAAGFRRHVANTLAFLTVEYGEILTRELLDARVTELERHRESVGGKTGPLGLAGRLFARVARALGTWRSP